ncbi:MAG: tail fiber domain-containing protein [Flavobacteriaceae bacterium]|nr:tail fiber domain-containing protein [Flavobacteriaceae bacterium]
MHITSDCILFGGKNAGKQTNSAQISAGKHRSDTLCILGMSSSKSSANRKIEMWAEGGLKVNGTINSTSDIVAYASSDKRLKSNIKSIENPLDKIKKLSGNRFTWNEKQNTYHGEDYGLVAQEVAEVLPEIVTERENGYLAIKYEKMIPLLVECIKSQQDQIDQLKKLK